ncbi:DUF1837 domain-containing protein [Acidovorax sp. NCPPB 3859]|nr:MULTISPECIES: DUF1837 domain-containing protein [unclassified Acidovorax]MDA8452870.1 DUF1837 domain-containing protein [Acidovorax sp. GBBC 3297]MDA8462287.1 DUF1837 domain-containing protein [Acidovorax sp. GBBC 3333]MDA8467312.1 DUF1837 domain-containing protein [Acidovorax sp. GBBC 3332]MDA8472355.1 DUF1837 domain-containing protein [Acidovorax sp. GBBC 3299]WCM78306.1 DUF1837 domain-containing protein [Acidovorax sp. GBBC 712]
MKLDIIINECLARVSVPDDSSSSKSQEHFLALINDFEDGVWRHQRFHDLIWNNLSQTSLSARERESIIGEDFSKLRQAAMNLRLTDNEDDPGKGSEIAEVLLYAVMKNHYNALPVVPKIYYKQNKNDNAKGADSVHVVINNDGLDFSLWLGESKFYSDIGDARLDKVVQSVSEMLNSEKIRKENSIIMGLTDLGDLIGRGFLFEKICAALDRDRSIDLLKPRLHIPILLLHQCEATKVATALTPEYREALEFGLRERATTYFKKQARKIGKIAGYKDITFHLIALPVPDKKKIISDFTKFANILRGYGS